MYCPHCAHPDYLVWHQSCCKTSPFPSLPTNLSNSTRRQDPSLKQQVCQLYLEGMGMRATGRVLGTHNDDGVSLKLLIQKLNKF